MKKIYFLLLIFLSRQTFAENQQDVLIKKFSTEQSLTKESEISKNIENSQWSVKKKCIYGLIGVYGVTAATFFLEQLVDFIRSR